MSEENQLAPDSQDVSLPQQFTFINYSPNPISFSNNDELIARISSYFDYCNTYEQVPTFTGLALHLGLTRFKLKNISEESPFFSIIQKAKQYIVDFAEKQLFAPKSSAGVAFWLKNNDDWVDKTDISLSTPKTIGQIVDEINLKNQSPIAYDDPTIPQLSEPKNQ